MRNFDYERPGSVAEAVDLLGGSPGVRALSGGTDLVPLLKMDLLQPSTLVDLKRLPDLPSGIEVTDDGVRIGALTRLSALEHDTHVRQQYPVLAEAVGLAATPQIRNMATLGGNLVQRPRCWYFRSPLFACWLKGGSDCFAREGENALHAIFDASPCVAVHPSDPAVALLALDARVQTTARSLAIGELFVFPSEEHRTESVLRPDELIVSVDVPRSGDGWRSTYRKAMNRKAWAFALVSVAVALRLDNGVVADARVALGGVAPIPMRSREAEKALIGRAPTPDAGGVAAAAALAGAQPLRQSGYKTDLVHGLIRQALASLDAGAI